MKWLVLWVTLVALILLVTAAGAESLTPGKPDQALVVTPPAAEVVAASPTTLDQAAAEKAVEFKTGIDARYAVRDVVTVTISNPLAGTLKGKVTLTLPGEKPLQKGFKARAGKSDTVEFKPDIIWDGLSPISAEAKVTFEGSDFVVTRAIQFDTCQRLVAIASCPLGRSIEFRIINPSKRVINGKLRLFGIQGIQPKSLYTKFSAESQTVVTFMLADPAPREFKMGYQLEDGTGRVILKSPVLSYTILEDFSGVTNREKLADYEVITGDEPGSPPSAIIEGAVKSAPYSTMTDLPSCRLRYNFIAADKPIRIVPTKVLPITDNPIEVGAWIYGDEGGPIARCALVDSTGRIFESSGFPLDWRGWRYKTMSLAATGDAKPKPPLKWDSIFMLDPAGKASRGLIYIGPVMLVSGP